MQSAVFLANLDMDLVMTMSTFLTSPAMSLEAHPLVLVGAADAFVRINSRKVQASLLSISRV